MQAAFTHEELLLRSVLGLGEDVTVNASGGALKANPIMATGLSRIGYAAPSIFSGGARSLAHATSDRGAEMCSASPSGDRCMIRLTRRAPEH